MSIIFVNEDLRGNCTVEDLKAGNFLFWDEYGVGDNLGEVWRRDFITLPAHISSPNILLK
jgi:hypothetical protein